MIIPKTSKQIIDSIMMEHHYSIKDIARALDMTPKAIYDVQKGNVPSSRTDLNTMLLFIKVKILSECQTDPHSPKDISRLKKILLQPKKRSSLVQQKYIEDKKFLKL